ncbi:hypothetical protein D3C85_1388440 [compost metagenome]
MLQNEFRSLDTIHTRHPDIHQYYLRPQLKRFGIGVYSIYSGSNDFDIRFQTDEGRKTFSHEPLVVYDQNSQLSTRSISVTE